MQVSWEQLLLAPLRLPLQFPLQKDACSAYQCTSPDRSYSRIARRPLLGALFRQIDWKRLIRSLWRQGAPTRRVKTLPKSARETQEALGVGPEILALSGEPASRHMVLVTNVAEDVISQALDRGVSVLDHDAIGSRGPPEPQGCRIICCAPEFVNEERVRGWGNAIELIQNTGWSVS